jgi:hypothetical protein
MSRFLRSIMLCGALTLVIGFIEIEGPTVTVNAEQYYTACRVTVPNAGDPIRNGYAATPSHEYWSETFDATPLVRNGNHIFDDYTAWVRKHYSSSWVYNGYSKSYGDSTVCSGMTLDQYKQRIKEDDHKIVTLTDWPAVPDYR